MDDVDRLVALATPNRLYNAACAVAILSEKIADDRLISHAVDLLALALNAGFPRQEAAADPDLKPLRSSQRFAELTTSAPQVGQAFSLTPLPIESGSLHSPVHRPRQRERQFEPVLFHELFVAQNRVAWSLGHDQPAVQHSSAQC